MHIILAVPVVGTGILRVQGTHLEDPLDAASSSIRQLSLQAEAHSAAEQEYRAIECASVLSCKEAYARTSKAKPENS